MIITMIRPEGIWQSSDFRITRGEKREPDAPKHLHILCPPLGEDGPQILLTFTGLAEFPDGTATIQWVRETIRGETRAIMPLLDHLRDRLTRDVGRSAFWRNPLVLSGGIFEGDKRFYVEFRNFDVKTRKPSRTFEYKIAEVTSPVVLYGGSGADYISAGDHELLVKQTGIRPAKWEDYLGLVAAVNRRTAGRAKGTVSPWCEVSFLGRGSQSAHRRQFRKPGEPQAVFAMEMVICGIDIYGLTKSFHEDAFNRFTGRQTTEFDIDKAGPEAVDGRP